MKVLLGYFVVTLIGLSASQSLLSLIQNPSRRLQLRRNNGFDIAGLQIQRRNLGIHDADHVNIVPSPRASAHASASSSIGIAGGLAGIRLNDLLGGSGLLAGHVGVQPQTLPGIAVRRSSQVVRTRPNLVIGQPGVGTTMLFDTPDPNTPDTPDLVYAPRSIMGDIHQIEALRNRAEADGVVFV